MNSAILPRHPILFVNESAWGYILRLSRTNGYMGPAYILRRAGIIKGNTVYSKKALPRHLDAEKLAVVIGRDRNELRSMFRSFDTMDNPHLCPECVDELGFIETHWDEPYMIGCPIHGREALHICPKCCQKLTWHRPALLRCGCGADLRRANLSPISSTEIRILDAIRRKVCKIDKGYARLGCSVEQLEQMSFTEFLESIKILGTTRLSLDAKASWTDPRCLISAAAEVLQNWPIGALRLFTDIQTVYSYGEDRTYDYRMVSAFKRMFQSLYPCETKVKYCAILSAPDFYPYERKMTQFFRYLADGIPFRLLFGPTWKLCESKAVSSPAQRSTTV